MDLVLDIFCLFIESNLTISLNFIQNSTISQCGSFSNGRVLTMMHNLSFIVLGHSSHPVTFTIMPSVSQAFLMYSNHLSLSLCLILNPLPSYALIIGCRDIMIFTVSFHSKSFRKYQSVLLWMLP